MGKAQFYVHSVVYEQQVILLLSNQDRARIFAARIDFQSRDPTSALCRSSTPTVTTALRLQPAFFGFTRLVEDPARRALSSKREEDVIIAYFAATRAKRRQQRKQGQHRRRKDSASSTPRGSYGPHRLLAEVRVNTDR